MGFVYIVRDEVVNKRFAIKQLSELHAENRILRERFRREASTWLLLDYHPHIVQAHSYLARGDAPLLILEYVDGPSLERLMRAERRIAATQVITYARQFCLAMQHAHSRVIPDRGVGVLHRDIKPGNLLLTRTNQIKTTDFGLAKIQGDTNLTSEGQFVGTVAYSPPEQLRGGSDVSKASDVYSFGAVMYQMLTGRQPFRGSNPAELYYAVQETAPSPIRELNPDVDAAVAAVVLRCLNKDPADRFADFHQLEKALCDIKPTLIARQVPCNTCGFISARALSKCSVCGVTVTREHEASTRTRRKRMSSQPALDPDAPLPVDGIAECIPACQGEQKSAWNLDGGKEYLVELQANGLIVPRLLERSGYTLGRGDNMKIKIEDSSIARYQLFLVRLPCGWLAMNPQLQPVLQVNGWQMRQRVLRPGDLLHVGKTWLAFAGPQGAVEPLTPLPGRWLERTIPKDPTVRISASHTVLSGPERTTCTLQLPGNKQFTSRGQPLRVGSSPLCEVQIDDPSVAPVHAMVTWQLDGPHLISVANINVRQVGGDELSDHLLQDGDLLQVGAVPIRARLEGDVSVPGQLWAKELTAASRFALTVLNGPQRGHTVILPIGQTVTLGRHTECDTIIDSDTFISRRHIEITASESEIDLRDLGSRCGFFLNQTHFTNAVVGRLGDVVVVGRTSLLIHHELELDG
jgi:serine/threonine protein kinase/pSer/pThr/pTyr-binding forkhead associated (FHA) protein